MCYPLVRSAVWFVKGLEMIRYSIANLRSPNWEGPADWRQLRWFIESDNRSGDDTWKITPWQRSGGPNPHRSYLVTSQSGFIYAIFFRKV